MAAGLDALGDDDVTTDVLGLLCLQHRSDLPRHERPALVRQIHHVGVRRPPEAVDHPHPLGHGLDQRDLFGDAHQDVHRQRPRCDVADLVDHLRRSPWPSQVRGADRAEPASPGDRHRQLDRADTSARQLHRRHTPHDIGERSRQHLAPPTRARLREPSNSLAPVPRTADHDSAHPAHGQTMSEPSLPPTMRATTCRDGQREHRPPVALRRHHGGRQITRLALSG